MRAVFARRYLRTGKQRFAVFLILFTLLLFPCEIIYGKLTPVLAESASAEAINEISRIVAETSAEFDLGRLVSYDDPDRIFTDVASLNSIKADFAKKLNSTLKKSRIRISVPLGDVIGHPSTLGRGPRLYVRLSGFTSAVTDIQSEFISAGINQTLHRISMTVNVEYTLILPRFQTKKLTQRLTVPLSETVIIGDVPSYYR